jgi:hypothetical protein
MGQPLPKVRKVFSLIRENREKLENDIATDVAKLKGYINPEIKVIQENK